MRIQQDAADKWDRNKTTPIHIVYKVTTCKIWDINHNNFQFWFFAKASTNT